MNKGAADRVKIPLVLEIKGNSLDDGPGIRTVVFFKGCPLSCSWCHNPESKKAGPEISFDPARCVGCDACIGLCPEKALSRENPLFISRENCTLCFACTGECPSGALSRVGTAMSADEIMNKILPDKPFFDTSKGGVTLSGGEPTLFTEFTGGLLKSLRQKGIHTLLETCGLFNFDDFHAKIYPYLDSIFFDIKILDPDLHKKYCGVSNGIILENFKKLLGIARKDNKTLLPRTPLVPGITDTDANLTGIADFLAGLGIAKAALLSYNPLWHEKSDKIGVSDPYRDQERMTAFMKKEDLDRCRTIFRERGIES